MKKYLSVLLICLLLFACGCGRQETLPENATLGQTITYDFKTRINENKSITPMQMAEALLENDAIEFKGAAVEVQRGLLAGFNGEIEGFETGIRFSPVIGAIPFIGYIFEVEADEDIDEFKERLKSESNPRWNVCSEADETFVESSGNMVLFLMSPIEFED